MSAAEKLRGAAPWDQWREYLNADLMDLIEGDDMERVLNALPQLIAVVEAAERREDFAASSVARLVADLDAALTVDGKTPDAKPDDELRDEGIHDAFDANQWD